MPDESAPRWRLKSPFAVLVASPSQLAGFEVLEALELAGKHLETHTLEMVRDTKELAVGVVEGRAARGRVEPGMTIIAGRHFVRRLLERPRGVEERVCRAFPKGRVVVARAWEGGYGYAVYEGAEKIRHRVVVRDEVLFDEGELLDGEEALFDEDRYDLDGEPDEEGNLELGGQIAASLFDRYSEGMRAAEMDLYEGPL